MQVKEMLSNSLQITQLPADMQDIALATLKMEVSSRFADQIANSKFLPFRYQNKTQDIAVAIMYGSEVGLKPMQSLHEIYIINNIPSMSTKCMLALIRQRCPDCFIKSGTSTNGAWVEMARTQAHAERGEGHKAIWDLEMAQRRGLIGKQNWKNNPTMMMLWRCQSECARMIFPDIIGGFYTPDEAAEQPEQVEGDEFTQQADKIQEKFKEPQEIVSTSAETEIPEAEREIIKHIENRDFEIQFGSRKGKKLREIPREELGEMYRTISNTITKNAENGKKPNDVVTALHKNIGFYLDSYESIVYEKDLVDGQEKKKEN